MYNEVKLQRVQIQPLNILVTVLLLVMNLLLIEADAVKARFDDGLAYIAQALILPFTYLIYRSLPTDSDFNGKIKNFLSAFLVVAGFVLYVLGVVKSVGGAGIASVAVYLLIGALITQSSYTLRELTVRIFLLLYSPAMYIDLTIGTGQTLFTFLLLIVLFLLSGQKFTEQKQPHTTVLLAVVIAGGVLVFKPLWFFAVVAMLFYRFKSQFTTFGMMLALMAGVWLVADMFIVPGIDPLSFRVMGFQALSAEGLILLTAVMVIGGYLAATSEEISFVIGIILLLVFVFSSKPGIDLAESMEMRWKTFISVYPFFILAFSEYAVGRYTGRVFDIIKKAGLK